MATGLNIRDFTKVYRELRYADSGSIRLTETEHNAYLLRLTIEVTHYDAYRSVNFKTLPENTHWGYCTAFKGSSVVSNTPIKFTKQRVFELINKGIWDYHQATETLQVLTSVVQKFGNLALGELSSLSDGIGVVGIVINLLEGLEDITEPAVEWLIEQVVPGDITPNNPAQKYTAYPVASPFPDVFKFQTDIPASFLFRLESWYLVNPLVYTVSNPTDTSDETEDEGEYPSPQAGDGDGAGQEFPQESERDPRNDSRDYSNGDYGEQGTWTVTLNYFDAGNNPACNQVPDRPFVIAGYATAPPVVITTAPPNETGAPAKSLQTALQTLPIARDCGVTLVGEATFTPGQVVFP